LVGHFGILAADCLREIFKVNLTEADCSQKGVAIHDEDGVKVFSYLMFVIG
jgi:hypothetical protein